MPGRVLRCFERLNAIATRYDATPKELAAWLITNFLKGRLTVRDNG
jgi:hypothetical protein